MNVETIIVVFGKGRSDEFTLCQRIQKGDC